MNQSPEPTTVQRIGRVLKHELYELLPPTVFFFFGFNLIALTLHLVLQEDGVLYDGMTSATVGALVVGKVVLIVDKVPLKNLIGRPLIWSVLRRTAVYTFFVMLTHLLEGLIGKWVALGTFQAAWDAARAAFVWQHSAVILIWVSVLFFVFISFDEIRRVRGLPRLWTMLFERSYP